MHLFFLAWAALLLIWGTHALIRHGRGKWRFILIGLAHACAILGMAGLAGASRLFPTVLDDPGQTILGALPPALAMAVPGAFISIWMQRRTNPLGTINPFLPSAVLALVLTGAALISAGWHQFGNGWLDAADARMRQGTVLRVDEHAALVQGDDGQKFAVRGLDPTQVAPGGHVAIRTKPGYHGMEWIADVEITPPI